MIQYNDQADKPYKADINTPRVLIVQRIIPPYRLPFFTLLAKSRTISTTFSYGKALASSGLESVLEPPSLKVVHIRNIFIYRERFVYQFGLLKLLKSEKFDTVIAEFNPRIISNIVACLYSRYRHIPFIWWGQGYKPHSTYFTIWLRIWLIQLADGVIFYDTAQAIRFISLGIPAQKVFVAPNSIEVETINSFVQERSLDKRKSVLYIGRLIPTKKVDVLIHAFAFAYPYLVSGTRLIIIGEGPERARLEDLVTQLHIGDNVEFTGAIHDQESLAPWFNNSWASISPGAVGLSAIHSLAYGIPMIVARNEAHGPEAAILADGINSVFFPSDDVEGLAKKLIELSGDAVKWERMAHDARTMVQERFGLAGMVRAFEQATQFAYTTRLSTGELTSND